MVVGHPLGEDGAAAADDARDPFGYQPQVLDQHAGVDRHVIDALGGLLLDDFEHYFGVEVFHTLHARNGFVDGHGADRDRRVAEDGLANFVYVAAGGEIHHRVGAVVDCGVEFLELLIDLGGDGGVADVGVDLAEAGHADRHGLEFGMIDIGGDDHAATGDFIADKLGRELFFVGDEGHFFGNDALAGVVHLGEVAVRVLLLAARNPVGARLRDGVGDAVRTIRGSHGNPSLQEVYEF